MRPAAAAAPLRGLRAPHVAVTRAAQCVMLGTCPAALTHRRSLRFPALQLGGICCSPVARMRRTQAALLVAALAVLGGTLAQSAERGAALADVTGASRGSANSTSTTTGTPRATAAARNNTVAPAVATNATSVRCFLPYLALILKPCTHTL